MDLHSGPLYCTEARNHEKSCLVFMPNFTWSKHDRLFLQMRVKHGWKRKEKQPGFAPFGHLLPGFWMPCHWQKFLFFIFLLVNEQHECLSLSST